MRQVWRDVMWDNALTAGTQGKQLFDPQLNFIITQKRFSNFLSYFIHGQIRGHLYQFVIITSLGFAQSEYGWSLSEMGGAETLSDYTVPSWNWVFTLTPGHEEWSLVPLWEKAAGLSSLRET